MLLHAQPGRSTILSAYVDTADDLFASFYSTSLPSACLMCMFQKNGGTMQILSYFESSTKIRVNTRRQALCVVWPCSGFGSLVSWSRSCLFVWSLSSSLTCKLWSPRVICMPGPVWASALTVRPSCGYLRMNILVLPFSSVYTFFFVMLSIWG